MQDIYTITLAEDYIKDRIRPLMTVYFNDTDEELNMRKYVLNALDIVCKEYINKVLRDNRRIAKLEAKRYESK